MVFKSRKQTAWIKKQLFPYWSERDVSHGHAALHDAIMVEIRNCSLNRFVIISDATTIHFTLIIHVFLCQDDTLPLSIP